MFKNIITLGREYGSGGSEIGRCISQSLGIPFYDKELLAIASNESGINEDLFYNNDEENQGSIIYSLAMGAYPLGEGGKIFPDLPLNHKLFLAQFDAIKNIARKGPCVIVGRCADYVLSDMKKVVSVFVTSDMEAKKDRIRLLHPEVAEKKLEDFIKKTDKKRTSYYNYFTSRKWGSCSNYDLSINSSRLSIENAAQIIINYIEKIEQ